MYYSGRMAERTSTLSMPSTITIRASRGRSAGWDLKWGGLPELVPFGRSEEESQRCRSPFSAVNGNRIWQA
jgi:hypothetical protein